ncbi:MAG: CYTH domain-containing protein [Patescibacteria group bacterium]|nr:hypothetical protein [Patescibacteria group bacterium]MBU0880238.1 hypothetical protein [Patescibacteria group bacterium]MBU0897865.1 hypothetical protein [Patescibacteria group bacterium]MBU1062879.1 hypothetical protein [Patescibacteria group bacterium]MBU1783418.1 hypothetical protein [Patescibacteria group bacterium]
MNNKEYREYEIEVRAHISKADFWPVLDKLTGLFGKPETTEIKTFLFRNPNGYDRIRILKDSKRGVLTKKIGSYANKAREEINRDFSLDEVDDIILELKSKGSTECSYLGSTGHAFSGLGSQKLYLSKHEHLGNFLEVEAITKKQSEIKEIHRTVSKTLTDLNLQELSATKYQIMMDQMCAKTLRPVSEYRRKEISQF